ncbi:MAG: hypothetical protein ABI618_06030 [Nitrospirota bacterium]
MRTKWSDKYLRERLGEFGLESNRDKTRLLEFWPYVAQNLRAAGHGKPEIFSFLGFMHICGKRRSHGRCTVLLQTMRKRLQTKLMDVKYDLLRRTQTTKVTCERMMRQIDNWIPPASICHPYPLRRRGVIN